MSGLNRLERARSVVGRRLGLPWSHPQPQPARPEPLPVFRLFGLVTSWMEADVIAATVSNARTQGCERVYLIDNDSPDDSVGRALAAGALLGASFSSPRWREEARVEIVNQLIPEISTATGDAHVWWLVMDADEFYNGPQGSTIRQYLDRLDRRFRAVGASALHHLPSLRPANLPGFHPVDFQPLADTARWAGCRLPHWKHPLLRWDRGAPKLEMDSGLHQLTGPACPVREPTGGVVLHHFPFRDEKATRRRLDALNTADSTGVARVDRRHESQAARWRTVDAAYAGRWDEVAVESCAPVGLNARPWHSLVGPGDRPIARWYGPEELAEAIAAWQAQNSRR